MNKSQRVILLGGVLCVALVGALYPSRPPGSSAAAPQWIAPLPGSPAYYQRHYADYSLPVRKAESLILVVGVTAGLMLACRARH